MIGTAVLPRSSPTGKAVRGYRLAESRSFLRLFNVNVLPVITSGKSRLSLIDMQLLGRPMARVVFLSPGLGLQLIARRGLPFGELSRSQLPPICLRCRTPEGPARFFSSQPPSKYGEKGEAPGKEEAKASGGETPSGIDNLPSSQQNHNGMKEKFSELMDTLQSRALTASQTLNDLTGYTGIEAIKAENDILEKSLADAHARLRAARHAYKSSNAKRATTQREVTTLLARKEMWTPVDLERFTELYRTDHVLEGEVATAQEKLTEAEAEEQSLSQRLNAGILKRYHEEQIWSDRIRRASTWGTWGLMGMNFLLFLILQFVAEPWRRKRLVKGVVAEEKEVLEQVRGELSAVKAALEARAEEAKAEEAKVEEAREEERRNEAITLEQPVIPPPTTDIGTVSAPEEATGWKQILLEPERWKTVAQDLYSERRLDLRMRDASALALQGAAAGAAIAGSLVWMLARRT